MISPDEANFLLKKRFPALKRCQPLEIPPEKVKRPVQSTGFNRNLTKSCFNDLTSMATMRKQMHSTWRKLKSPVSTTRTRRARSQDLDLTKRTQGAFCPSGVPNAARSLISDRPVYFSERFKDPKPGGDFVQRKAGRLKFGGRLNGSPSQQELEEMKGAITRTRNFATKVQKGNTNAKKKIDENEKAVKESPIPSDEDTNETDLEFQAFLEEAINAVKT
eukprot:TRINITY_DN248125_c0_g1_i1.p1 TRINITY_DN248125_c0_g1~~TRINITY_DN248125_c0_g1_i1.p1  ORF type:complete len:219 (+),score=45.99 TRINITY_DN248125_c0_g1_i1:52-708(+)